jgi:hypothetical protein
MPLRWRSDLSKLILKANFDRRGWVEAEDDHPSGEAPDGSTLQAV